MTPDITDDDVCAALSAFLFDVAPNLTLAGPDPRRNVRQGQQNDVPMPPGPNFVIMIPADRSDLATTTRAYRPIDDERDTTRPVKFGVNLNFYGPNASDFAQTFAILFRDLYGCDFFRSFDVQPLWCDDGRQMPLVDSEKQYATRWMIHALLQINPTVSTSQQFADTTTVTILEADQ